MRRISPKLLLRYGGALLSVALATLARVPLYPYLGDTVPFITYFVAVMAAAWLGGMGPGLLAVLLSALAATYLWFAPAYMFAAEWPGGWIALGLFVLFSSVIVAVCEMMNRERRRAERLASIVNSSDDAIIGKTLDGTITSWNAGAERLYGYTAAEVLGRNISLLMPPAASEDLPNILERIRRGERVEHFETQRLRRDGTTISVSLTVSPVRDEDGRIVGASAIARDITARLTAERNLRDSEDRSRRAQRAARVGTWDWDLLTDEVAWSEGIYDLLGLEQGGDEPSAKNFEQFIHPEDREPSRQRLERALREGAEEFYDEFRVERRDGAERRLAAKARIARDSEGRAVRLIGVNYDITETKRAEERLRISEERFRLAASGEAITLFEHDRLLRYVWLYPHHAEHYDNSYGKTDADLLADPSEAEALTSLKRHVLETGGPARREVRVTTRAGLRWYDIIVEPKRDGRGEVTGVAGVAFDVTTRKLAEEERERLLESERAARREAEEASRIKDEFLATVSHELRTPLTAINGWAVLLRSGQLDAQTAAHGCEVIERNARVQKQIIADLLDVSRIVAGKMRLDVGRVELGETVRAAAESVRLAAESKNIELSVETNGGVEVVGDPDRLQQVVWNLLSNAVKFTPAGGSITARLERGPTHALVSVTDTGQGIKADFLPYVFDRFRQADSSTTRRHGGLGLGLSIVKHLVELHGGTARAASEGEGHGAVFTVSLPLAGDDDGQDNAGPDISIADTV